MPNAETPVFGIFGIQHSSFFGIWHSAFGIDMEHLWSPWRLAYITGASPTTGCVFCNALTDPEADSLVVFRGTACFVILNLFPYNNGHLMVIPNRHIATLASATPEERAEMIELTMRAEIALTDAYAPHGLNM